VKVQGSHGQLGDRGCARTCLLVRMGGVHTACDWSGQTVPVDGAEVCTSYSDPPQSPSLMMAPLASVTEYFLSRGLLQSVFRITDPGVLRLLSRRFRSQCSIYELYWHATYWLVVGLYQSITFTRPLWSAQTIAAQLETQLSHAELENLKSQLHPHFCSHSLHTIGILIAGRRRLLRAIC